MCAAINGHFVAAGAMLGLAFDFRVTVSDSQGWPHLTLCPGIQGPRGLFFVPGIDIGLVYSPGMTALMTAKTPYKIQRDLIVLGKRFHLACS